MNITIGYGYLAKVRCQKRFQILYLNVSECSITVLRRHRGCTAPSESQRLPPFQRSANPFRAARMPVDFWMPLRWPIKRSER